MNLQVMINISYLVSCVCFIFGLKMLQSPLTAKRGNIISASGMLLAIVATLMHKEVVNYTYIFAAILVGSSIGIFAAKKVKMTGMPEMVALLHGFGGIASLLVGWSIYHARPNIPLFTTIDVFLSIFIGGVTFTGSMIAWAKLSERLPGKPLVFSFQKIFNFSLIAFLIILGIIYCNNPQENYSVLLGIIAGSLVLGVMMVIPIGGADMPVVISLLNSYSGLAACAVGFVLENNLLIVSGALVGANGIILSSIMCRAMNRSLAHILFSGFSAVSEQKKEKEQREVKSLSPKDAYYVLEAAKSVVIVPGYGLAVAQAQHAVRELEELLEANGADVKYAIHPVAGRMPGHMNVLLAEANVPYDHLIEMENINRIMSNVDVCLVIGANDVVNPSARDDATSPIYGMPIIEADRAKNVFIFKRSMASGFAGIENPLFYKDNAFMIFGDAKNSLQALIAEF
ncbi:MAG: NAD(P)(+) transhydrogenase (Re/Si-specific) subunit beta [Chlamydiae bacterium]|nr:NAD(P)(+) transhydrogenase (Re/Si-specific) subunit beta [Chlamydiota bacterium]